MVRRESDQICFYLARIEFFFFSWKILKLQHVFLDTFFQVKNSICPYDSTFKLEIKQKVDNMYVTSFNGHYDLSRNELLLRYNSQKERVMMSARMAWHQAQLTFLTLISNRADIVKIKH